MRTVGRVVMIAAAVCLLIAAAEPTEVTEHLEPNDVLAPGAASPWLAGWTLDNRVWNLKKTFADTTARRTVLVFWATWCAPCKAGLDTLAAAAPQLDDAGVEVVLVNLDRDQATVERFLEQRPLPFLCVLDPFQKNTRRYFGLPVEGENALTLPRTVLLDRDLEVEAVLGREGEDYLEILLGE